MALNWAVGGPASAPLPLSLLGFFTPPMCRIIGERLHSMITLASSAPFSKIRSDVPSIIGAASRFFRVCQFVDTLPKTDCGQLNIAIDSTSRESI